MNFVLFEDVFLSLCQQNVISISIRFLIENFCISVIEKLVLIEVPVHPASIVDDNPETLNNPIIPENVGSQEPAAASFVSSGIGEF